MSQVVEQVRRILSEQDDILLAFVFGSAARGEPLPASDLDIAVAAREPLSAARRLSLIDDLALAFGRPVDLIDLQSAAPLIFRQALTTGRCVLKRDTDLYADLLKRLWYDHADLLPIHDLILRLRRERFVRG